MNDAGVSASGASGEGEEVVLGRKAWYGGERRLTLLVVDGRHAIPDRRILALRAQLGDRLGLRVARRQNTQLARLLRLEALQLVVRDIRSSGSVLAERGPQFVGNRADPLVVLADDDADVAVEVRRERTEEVEVVRRARAVPLVASGGRLAMWADRDVAAVSGVCWGGLAGVLLQLGTWAHASWSTPGEVPPPPLSSLPPVRAPTPSLTRSSPCPRASGHAA